MKVRAVKIVLTLQEGEFSNQNGANQKTIISTSLPNYLAIDVDITQQPGIFSNQCKVKIYGMLLEDIFALTRYNSSFKPLGNIIEVYAGYLPDNVDVESKEAVASACEKLSMIYVGNILQAGADLNNKNAPFTISGVTSGRTSYILANPVSYNSPVSFEVVVRRMVTNKNLADGSAIYSLALADAFVDKQINKAHYSGDFITQIRAICNDYGYQFTIYNNVVTIATLGHLITQRKRVISVETGLIGYPVVLPMFFSIVTFFDPTMAAGQSVELDTAYRSICNVTGKDSINKAGTTALYQVNQIQSRLQTNGEDWVSHLGVTVIIKQGDSLIP